MTSLHLTRGNTQFAHLASDYVDFTTLNCGNRYGPVQLYRTERVFPRHPLARGVHHPFGTEPVSMLPKAILQTYLEEVGQAVLCGRLETYCSKVQLPLNILTSSASLKVSTIDDLQDGFDEHCDMMRGIGVTDMARTVHVAQFQRNDQIVGIYDTRLLSGTRQVLPTFYSKMWIGNHDGVWKAEKIHNTTKEARWPLTYTRLAFETWPIEEI